MSSDLVVLFEDNHCLAVAKPAGLLTQAPPGVDSLEERVRAYLKDKYQKKGRVYLGVVHRLDRPVSGVVLFARQSVSARRLSEQFRDRQVRKTYWGLVEGEVQPPTGRWEDWLRKVDDEARVERVAEGTAGAKVASLDYRCMQAGRLHHECTLVEFRLETGRMHQIRVQAAARGWPIRGDYLYGARFPFGPPADSPRDRAIALHAHSLEFLHPVRYEPIAVTAPLPGDWGPIRHGAENQEQAKSS